MVYISSVISTTLLVGILLWILSGLRVLSNRVLSSIICIIHFFFFVVLFFFGLFVFTVWSEFLLKLLLLLGFTNLRLLRLFDPPFDSGFLWSISLPFLSTPSLSKAYLARALAARAFFSFRAFSC